MVKGDTQGMKCYKCNGTGYYDIDNECPVCDGTGEYEPFDADIELDKLYPTEQTNEEWLDCMYTEAKAEWLADHMKCSKCPQQNRCNGYHGGCVGLMLEWLKHPHKRE